MAPQHFPGMRSHSGGASSANTSGPTSPQGVGDVWDLSIFKVPKPKSCIFWCKHCPPGLRRFLLWLWFCVGLAAAITAAVLIIRDLKVNRQRDLELECQNRANVLQSELRAACDQGLMYSGFVLTLQGNLSQANFQRFGETTISARFLLGRIAYLIRVTQEQRPLYDTPSFPFTQNAPNSPILQVPRNNASEYALVQYTAQEPLRANIFGLDIASDPILAGTISQARDSGNRQLSPPRILYNGLLGFVIIFPVYNISDMPANATVEMRRDACVGYTYAQVNAQTLAKNVFANFTTKGVDSRIYDVTTDAASSSNLLYASEFQNLGNSSQVLLDQGFNVSTMVPNWKPDYAIPIKEEGRTYSLQCRKREPENTRIVLTGIGYGVLIIFVVLMAALTMKIAFVRMDSMEKEAARMRLVWERLSMAKAAAEAADTAKGRFLATVSHEIRTPLNGVLGCMSLLLDTPLNDVQLDYVRTARASGKALVALVNDVLDLSKVEAGAMELEMEPFDIRSLIEDVLGMFSSTTREKGLELAGLVRDGVPDTVVGDAGRIRQVLINLLGNAVKFTQKGSVFICVWAAYVPKATASAADTERLGPAVTWVSKEELDSSGRGAGATLRRPKQPFGSPSIMVNREAGPLEGAEGSFREDDGRQISKSSMFSSVRLGQSARFSDTSRGLAPGEQPAGILKAVSSLGVGASSRFKHVTISIPDPAGDDPRTPERERERGLRGGLGESIQSASFSHKLKQTFSGLTRAALLRRAEQQQELSKASGEQVVPPAGSADGSGGDSRPQRRSFEVYNRGGTRSNDLEMGPLKETPEGSMRDPLIGDNPDGSSKSLGHGGAGSSPDEELEQRIFFRVEDTGPGVPPNVQSRLFRPFQQADSSTSRKFGGTGIGLVISERLVSLMGGSVVAWSETHVGTSFQFDISMPAVDVAPPTPSSGGQSPINRDARNHSPKAPSELEGTRAIIVQDEEVRREVAVSILQRMQLSVVGVCNCAEALELALAAHTHEADRKARGVSPAPSPRGFGVLRRKLTNSGISSSPGIPGDLLNPLENAREESRANSAPAAAEISPLSLMQFNKTADSSASLVREVSGVSTGSVISDDTAPLLSRKLTGTSSLSAQPSSFPFEDGPPGHQRPDSRTSLSSNSSGGSTSSPIAEQGRLPSLRLWNMAEDEDGEDKDVEKVIAAGEKALLAAERLRDDAPALQSRSALEGYGLGGANPGTNPGLTGPETEQLSLGSGETPESTTPSFADVAAAQAAEREPFGRAPDDANDPGHVSIDVTSGADVAGDGAGDAAAAGPQGNDDSLALQDAADGGAFRLVLVDVDCVGRASALEFAKQVKDDPRLSDLLVVGMCVGGPHSQEEEGGGEVEKAGLLGPVFKPLRQGALAAILHSAMHPEGSQLPRSPPGEEMTPSTAASTPIGKLQLDGRKVLVVDDVAINVKVASRMLAALKCQVLTAASGPEAIEIYRKEKDAVDLILMDVQMPEMDGFEATQKIREIAAEWEAQGTPKRKVPILALTADVMSGTKEECLQAGMDGYLPKPLNPKKLRQLLYEFIGSE